MSNSESGRPATTGAFFTGEVVKVVAHTSRDRREDLYRLYGTVVEVSRFSALVQFLGRGPAKWISADLLKDAGAAT